MCAPLEKIITKNRFVMLSLFYLLKSFFKKGHLLLEATYLL